MTSTFYFIAACLVSCILVCVRVKTYRAADVLSLGVGAEPVKIVELRLDHRDLSCQ